jgi:hypothetical protein
MRRYRAWAFACAAAGVLLLSSCGGDDGGTSPAPLGEEIDIAEYAPGDLDGYFLTYRTTTAHDTVETDTWYVGNETVYDYDPDPANPTEVDCFVTQQENDGITSAFGGDMRMYSDGRYVYGIKIYGGGTWEPFYNFRPKMKLLPDANPHVGEVFDSGPASFVFTYEEDNLRDVFWVRSWTRYLAIEDSLTVPAGTFHEVLKTEVRQRACFKRTAISDTTSVVAGSSGCSEGTYREWSAPGIGTIRMTGTTYERVLISGTVEGVTYP